MGSAPDGPVLRLSHASVRGARAHRTVIGTRRRGLEGDRLSAWEERQWKLRPGRAGAAIAGQLPARRPTARCCGCCGRSRSCSSCWLAPAQRTCCSRTACAGAPRWSCDWPWARNGGAWCANSSPKPCWSWQRAGCSAWGCPSSSGGGCEGAVAGTWTELRASRHHYLFVAVLAGLVTLVCGLAPARQATGVDVSTALKSSVSSSAGLTPHRRHASSRELLAGVQLALALVLLIGTGLLLRSLVAHLDVPLGLDARDVAVFRTALPPLPALTAAAATFNAEHHVKGWPRSARRRSLGGAAACAEAGAAGRRGARSAVLPRR